MNKKEAQAVAEKAIKTVDNGSDYEYVGSNTTIIAGRDNHGYWVADNGDEASGLSRPQAIKAIIDCLAE